jgi:hypothetical protein
MASWSIAALQSCAAARLPAKRANCAAKPALFD